MRLLARLRDTRFRGSAHSLRSAFNHFTLVEPFPNGKLYFKRAVDRPVCVYVIGDKLFVLGSELQAFTVLPAGGGRFNLVSARGFLSPGEFVDGDTCLPTTGWPDAKAWEHFCLGDPPTLDRRECATIAALGGDTAGLRHRTTATSGRSVDDLFCVAERYDGSVDFCEGGRAAGWAARGNEPAIVSVYVNGVLIGEAKSAGERPDVAAAGFARHSAWSFVLPHWTGSGDRLVFRFPDGSPLPSAVGQNDRRRDA